MKHYQADESSELLGPGTDLIISLLGVLLLALAMYAAKDGSLVKIERYQIETIEQLATRFKGVSQKQPDSLEGVYYVFMNTKDSTGNPDIIIENDVTLQRITFGEKFLFKRGDSVVIDTGRPIIDSLALVILERGSKIIEEIIIQGHTDTSGSDAFNMSLGAKRAVNVMKLLTRNGRISPHEFLVSATSFGPFKPIQRREGDTSWNITKTYESNKSKPERKLNRRIDIILNYRESI